MWLVKLIKQAIKKMMANPLLWRTIGVLIRRRGVVVLMYHRVSPQKGLFPALSLEKFRQQLQWLKKNCHILHPNNFTSQTIRPTGMRPSILITFDDGHRCIYDVIYPVLKELGIPAIVFLATKCMDDGSLIWTDEVTWALRESRLESVKLPWDPDQEVNLATIEDRNSAAGLCKRYLKSLSDIDRKHWLSLLLQALNAGDPMQMIDREMLGWDEVRACQDVFEFGGHTHTHPIMSKLDKKSLENEVLTCRERLMDETGSKPTVFAYPNGEIHDYNQDCKDVLAKYGFKTAFTTIEGINTKATDLMELKRIPTGARAVEDLAWMILRA